MKLHIKLFLLFNFLILLLFSCIENNTKISVTHCDTVYYTHYNSLLQTQAVSRKYDTLPRFEQLLLHHNFIPIAVVDSTIQIDLKYATNDNEWNTKLYEHNNCAYLEYRTAQMLSEAQHTLRKQDAAYSLVVYDAVRPFCVQEKMWNTTTLTGITKRNFLASPAHKSLHNYGIAVDVSIYYNGKEMDMGTRFDFPGITSYTYNEEKLIDNGTLSKHQVCNRRILRKVMQGAGFISNKYEWWHFSSVRRKNSRNYPFVYCFDSIVEPQN
ncbi:MAG: M15 family metallopeptidase [Bacteroidales bacterium]